MSDLRFAITGQDLGELSKFMFSAVTDAKRLGAIFNVQTNVSNGDKVVLIGDLGLQGTKAAGCSPTWAEADLTTDKTWKIDPYSINLKNCWADIPAALQRLIKNADGADQEKNVYLDQIVKPRLENAVEKMYTRLGWFGSATDQSSKLKVAGNKPYFVSTFEGVWPYAVNYVSSHANQLVSVAANAQTTYAAQKAAMLVSGVATGIVDDMIMSASPALRQATDGVIFMSLAMADVLDYDIRKNNKGSELQWQSIFNGVKVAMYNGVEVVAVPQFDEVLANFKEADAAPFRAIYTTKSNIMLGMHGDEDFATVHVDYDAYHQLNLLSILDFFGVLIAQDDLFVLAI